ncbi:MAG: hypothetical protein EPO41_03910 [Reyranella sp.]|uniref:capsid assembly protein n=1 Tax=Reyranella sp. TaxID=1929291 RepID=UPI001209FEA9|nr:hypothetical protein [Reyranella sp.]TAJ97147.1 MAG: hypothetical protein EPO41_03910 [Reyranella sp.]
MTTEAQTPAIPESALPPQKGAEYAQEMLKKAEGAERPADQIVTEEQPKLLAGKYKTVEELEKGYAELMKQRGQQTNNKPADATPTEQKPATKTPEQIAADEAAKKAADDAEAARLAALTPEQRAAEEAAKKATQAAGLDMDKLNAEFAANGKIGEESYTALEKVGIPKSVVDQFIAGQQAAQKLARQEVVDTIGGEEEFVKIATWAAENVPAEELEAYNKIAKGSDIGATKVALAGLKAKYEAANGSEPNLIGGDTTSPAMGYKNEAEMKADMAKPEYAKDPAFRAKVIAKLRATTAF